MEVIIGIILILVIGAIVKTVKDKKERKEFNERETPKPTPSIADLPVGNYCIIDECTPEVAAGRETNGAQDVQAQLYLLISETGTKPKFIGVSCGEHGVNKQPTIDAIKELCLNIPILEGAPTYAGAKSELSDAIVAESKKGVFKIYLGSPAGDVARAFKDGAHIHNIKLPRLLEKTWNEKINPSASKYVLDRLQDKSGAVTEYYTLINRNNRPQPYKDEVAWINRNRDLKAWDIANSPEILKRNNELNNGKGVLRIADVLAIAKDLGFERDYARIFNGIQHGMDICKDRIARGAKETLVQTTAPPPLPKRAPITKADFDLASVDMQGFINPLKYRETSKVISASMPVSYSGVSSINHTEKNVWPGVNAEHMGQTINVNANITIFYVEDGKTKGMPFEYLRTNTTRMVHGAAKASHSIQSGDVIGIMASYIIRDGNRAKKQGTPKKRTNVRFIKVK